MAVDRLLPTDEARDLIQLTREVADRVLDPIVDAHEKAETYPERVFAQLGAAGLLRPKAMSCSASHFVIGTMVMPRLFVRLLSLVPVLPS